MKLLEALSKALAAAGIQADNADLAKVLADAELAGKELPDTLANPLLTLMGMDAAKANPTLSAHFKAEHLNGLDTQFQRDAKANGFDDAQIGQWMAKEITTGKRFELMLAKLQENHAEAIRKGKGQTEDSKALNDQITALQAKLTSEIKTLQDQLAAKDQAYSQQQLDWQIQELLASMPRNPNVTPEVFKHSALPMLNAALAAEGAKIVSQNGQLKLVQAANEAQPFFRNNVEMKLDAIAKETLLKSGLVAASLPNDPTKKPHIEADPANPNKPMFSTDYSAKSTIQQEIENIQSLAPK